MARTGRSWILLSLVMVFVSACQADVVLELAVIENGSGTIALTVTFDEEAVVALGDIEGELRLDDLADAGWQVSGPQATASGGARVTVSREVVGPNDWQPALDAIVGAGVFTDVEVTAGDDVGIRSQRLSLAVDLRRGWDLFSDDEVAAALGGERFGAPIEALTGGRSIDDIVSIDLQTSVASDDGTPPVSTAFSPRFDDASPLQVGVESTTENSTWVLLRWSAIALASLAALATILAITGVVLNRRAERLRPPPTPAKLAQRVPGGARVVAVPPEAHDRVRLVVVEPVTVLYAQSASPETNVLPFVRTNGGQTRADTILEAYGQLLSGEMDTARFWELCGVAGDPIIVDQAFITMRRMRPGAADFLREMQQRRIPVAAATDDAAEWSRLTRDRDRLSAVWPWVVSADVGATKPNLGIFEILRRESGIAFGHCLYVDTGIEHLDAARTLGMKTALFDTGEAELPAVVGHPVVTDFKGLFGKRTTR